MSASSRRVTTCFERRSKCVGCEDRADRPDSAGAYPQIRVRRRSGLHAGHGSPSRAARRWRGRSTAPSSCSRRRPEGAAVGMALDGDPVGKRAELAAQSRPAAPPFRAAVRAAHVEEAVFVVLEQLDAQPFARDGDLDAVLECLQTPAASAAPRAAARRPARALPVPPHAVGLLGATPRDRSTRSSRRAARRRLCVVSKTPGSRK